MSRVYSFLRYFVAFFVITYGFAKINGSQFTILESELDKPMREVGGFWLTWYYFGYSAFYGNFIALIQIGAGGLLLFRKTTLLACCMLLGVLANIILIDIFYAIQLGALLMAVLLEVCLLRIAAFHKEELLAIFWVNQNALFPQQQLAMRTRIMHGAVRILIFVIPAVLTYYIANYNNRFPTSLDGRWRVAAAQTPVTLGQEPLTYIYFERNRAYMCVFRFGQSIWETHHFKIDEQAKTLEIWQT